MLNRSNTILSSSLLVLLSIAIWVISGNFPSQDDGYPGPALFPRIISVALIISAVGIFFQKNEQSDSSEGLKFKAYSSLRLVGGLGLGLSFPFIASYIGLAISSGLVCLGIGLFFRIRWPLALTIALATTTILYLVFTLALGIRL